jgi:hypothetical protein
VAAQVTVDGYPGNTGHSITADRTGLCWICDEETRYVDLSFEAFVCSGTCEWAAWTVYWMALRDRDAFRPGSWVTSSRRGAPAAPGTPTCTAGTPSSR